MIENTRIHLNCLRQHPGFYCITSLHVKQNCVGHNTLRCRRCTGFLVVGLPPTAAPFRK